jgi:RHS repeat-associated protein
MTQPAAPATTYTAAYDAWNRLVKLESTAATVVKHYYDGAKRRIKTESAFTGSVPGETRHFYYTDKWQCIEERTDTSAERQFVWGVRFIDELILRDRAGTPNERLYVLQDGNWNTIGIVDESGAIKERYAYDPYGSSRVYDGSFNTRTFSSYNWELRQAGSRWDASSSLYIPRNRDYHFALGILLERDAMGFVDGLNLQQALQSNPIIFTDPYGTKCDKMAGPRCTGWTSSYSYPVCTWEFRRFYSHWTTGRRPGRGMYFLECCKCRQYCQLTRTPNPDYKIQINGCTNALDVPLGFNFKPCCDQHD